MTHGDKAKAKTGKSSQASAAAKKSSTPVKEAADKAVQAKSGGKAAPKGNSKGGGEGDQARKAGVKKAGAEKASPAPAEKSGAGAGKEGGGSSAKAGKAAASREAEPGSFTNPVIGNAFKHALKKYPNALRKLTD